VTEQPPWTPPPAEPSPRRRLGRRLGLAGAVAVVLALGGVAIASAANAPSPSPSPGSSAQPSPGQPGGPGQGPRERGPAMAGTVVSASGGTITITDLQGFQRTIHTTSATTYSDGLNATPAAGTKIVAVGTVDSDKTSLKATRVATLPDRPEGRGFPGGGFPGGPGRHHGRDGDKGTPSPGSGTPTPGPSTPAPSPSPTS
jgi:hypothetical protein